MVKRCCYGVCNTDSRYPDRLEGGVTFLPFPKRSNLSKCLRWIRACGRPHSQFNVDTITRTTYICTKHFDGGSGPTELYPDPIPYDGEVKPARKLPSRMVDTPRTRPLKVRRRLDLNSPTSENLEESICQTDKENNILNSQLSSAQVQTEGGWADPMDLLSLTVEKKILESRLAKEVLVNDHLKRTTKDTTKSSTIATKTAINNENEFSAANFSKNDDLMRYYTGFSNPELDALFFFLVPDDRLPLKLSKNLHLKLSIRDQLFLTLCKLRNNFDFKDLGYRFKLSSQDCSSLFSDWINYMFFRFGEISFWPHRDIIIENMPENYKNDFPTTLAIVDCTEIKIQKPSSLKAQSQSYSDYKSTNTLKSLVAVDPRGSVLFSSCLYSGSISDKDIFEKCGFKQLLKDLVHHGYLNEGDGLMADKGFNIEFDVEECNLKLNIPPFAKSGFQMSQTDVCFTKKIASHRVHVERTIGSIKKFKIVAQRIPLSLFGRVNQIWNVCSFLTTFQKPIISRK